MERSYTFFIGVFAILGGISFWSQSTSTTAVASATSPTPAITVNSPSEIPRGPASTQILASPKPLEIEAIESSVP
jgi:hypothetical protein